MDVDLSTDNKNHHFKDKYRGCISVYTHIGLICVFVFSFSALSSSVQLTVDNYSRFNLHLRALMLEASAGHTCYA